MVLLIKSYTNVSTNRACLRFALSHTPMQQHKNRQRILASLVPIEVTKLVVACCSVKASFNREILKCLQMCLGVMPTALVGTKYGFQQYVDLGEAVKRGDLHNFNRIMAENQVVFVHLGVYLVLENVRIIVYRNLFRRIFLIQDTTRLNLNSIQAALEHLGEDADLEEIECILCNLIYQNKIKGYISHEKKFLIVSKADPFPRAAITVKNPTIT